MPEPVLPMRCVVVLPDQAAGDVAPAPLINGLSKRGLSIAVTQGSPAAMVKLAQAPAAAIVVVEPNQLSGVSDLVHAVRAYHPSVVCWRYERRGGRGSGQLSAINGQYDHDNPPNPTPAEPLQSDPRQRVEPLVHHVDKPPQSPSPLISEAELAMLLGEELTWEENTGESENKG